MNESPIIDREEIDSCVRRAKAICGTLEPKRISNTPYRATRHALDRWRERFGLCDIEQEMSEAIHFGKMRGAEYLLSPCGAVFVVADRCVITVIPEGYALDNFAREVGR